MQAADLATPLLSSGPAGATHEGVATSVPLAGLPDSVPKILALAAEAATAAAASAELQVLGKLLLHHSAATAAEYCRDVVGFSKWCAERQVDLFSADRTTIELWTLSLQGQGYSPRTIRRRLAAVQGYYLEAVDSGLLERVPTLRVKRPPVARPAKAGIAKEDAQLLLEASEDSGPRDAVLVRLLLLNGLRASEVIALRIGDVGEERGHRTITVHRKGGQTTVEALSPGTRHTLDQLLALRPEASASDWLFVDFGGEPMSRHSVARVTRRLGRRVGIEEPLNPHELRHSFITLGLDAGCSLRDMQRAAAHADPRTTADYDRRRQALDTHPSYSVERHLA